MNPYPPRARYAPGADSPLARRLREQAALHLRSTQDHAFADAGMWLKIALLAAIVFSCYGLALTATNAMGLVLATIAYVFATMVLAMNSLHDAAHGSLCRSARANRLAMRLVALPLGIEPVYWTLRHVHYHHSHANVDGLDLDIEPNVALRQTPFQAWQPQYRWQHLYWPLVAAISLPWINWVFDWADRLGRTRLRDDGVLQGPRGWATFLLHKGLHGLLTIALPLWLTPLGLGPVLLAYALAQLLASCFLVATILGTHWADVAFFRAPADGQLPHSWHEHAFHTTVDWRGHWLLRPWLGGLDLHLTHHLFPTLSHRHYDALSPVVAQAARDFGLPYRCLRYHELHAAQQRFLRRMGRNPAVESVDADVRIA
ncbi:fatty acid desaturase family protein [Aquabacterium sp.]|uniref:fatty acid desaturase family protein n=1 Tax=Aquabacterium sp. TaxID=1872578 RepID=UPI003783E1D0